MWKASAAKKSREETNPGAGLNLNPVRSINISQHCFTIACRKCIGYDLPHNFFFFISNYHH